MNALSRIAEKDKFLWFLVLYICICFTGCSDINKDKEVSVNGLKISDEQTKAAGFLNAQAEVTSRETGFKGCNGAGGIGLDMLAVREGRLYTLYYDYDRLHIRNECEGLLRMNAEWVLSHPDVMISIEGHTDERGQDEYNLALGDKVASMIGRYLKDNGVSRSRFRTLSHGGEHPVDRNHNETAWARNRRIEFVIKSAVPADQSSH